MSSSINSVSLSRVMTVLRGVALGIFCWGSPVSAELVINSPMPITHRVVVQPIIVANDDGSEISTFMGTPAQQIAIENDIDRIWAQAGIDIQFLTPNFWNNTLANFGSQPANQVRSVGDLNQLVLDGDAEGVSHPSPSVLEMYLVQIAPGQAQQSAFSVGGRAQLDGPGSAIYIGSGLPGAESMGQPLGNEIVAHVMAHEIGHNLDLGHVQSAQNLMRTDLGTAPNFNARLDAGQVSIVRSSRFAVAVPEPTSGIALLVLLATYRYRGRRRSVSCG